MAFRSPATSVAAGAALREAMGAAGPTSPEERPPLAAAVLGIAAAVLLAHVVVAAITPYGVHRDELLYLAMGRHLRPWRMDFPPLIAIIAQVERGLFGDSLPSLRLAPAVAAAAIVLFAGMIAREIGGGRWAQTLASLLVALNPLFMRAGSLFQPVVFDQLWWTLGLLALARLGLRGVGPAAPSQEGARDWLLLGVAAGLGLLTKFSIAFFAAAVLLALVLSPKRGALLTRWPWSAAAVALAIGLPSVVGQIRLGFPVIGQLHDLQAAQLSRVGYGDFLLGQLLFAGPLVLVAVAGLLDLLLPSRLRPWRALGWTCLIAVLLLMLLHGKPYYAGPVYPTLFAAGAVAIERSTARIAGAGHRGRSRAARWAVLALGFAFGAVALPLGLPILPPAAMARYAASLRLAGAVTTNRGVVLALPQDYADMLGWPELADAVAAVWRSLPAADRAGAVLIAGNYGEAGALDFYGPRLGLPPAIAPVGSYWFFGPGSKPGEVAVVVGGEEAELRRYFGDVSLASRLRGRQWVVPEERDVPIWIARRPLRPIQRAWPELRGRN